VPHLLGGSAALVQSTASFRILTASLSGMSIYTHPTASGRAADAPDFPKPFQSLSRTLSL